MTRRDIIAAVPVLLIVVVGLCGCPRRETPTGFVQTAASDTAALPRYTVGMSGSQFAPPLMTAPPGQRITFLNNCTMTHTVTADPGTPAGGPNSDAEYPNGMQPGQSYVWTIPADAADGTRWHYHCRFHGEPGDGHAIGAGMAGSVIVAMTAVDRAAPAIGTSATPGASTGTGATGTTRSTGAGTAGTNRGTADGATTPSGTGGTGRSRGGY